MKESDQGGRPSGSCRLDGNGITKVMWRTRLEKLICDGNKFILNAFMYLQLMQRLENPVRIGEPGSSNNGTTRRILNALKTI